MTLASCAPYRGGLQEIGVIAPVSILNSKPRMGLCIPSSSKTSQYFTIMSRMLSLNSSGHRRHWRFVSNCFSCKAGSNAMTSSRGGSFAFVWKRALPNGLNITSTESAESGMYSGST